PSALHCLYVGSVAPSTTIREAGVWRLLCAHEIVGATRCDRSNCGKVTDRLQSALPRQSPMRSLHLL
ncbi:hypothetical protein PFISCL1PPCAC_13467, partial [Pristionchus fissidentatus]